MSIPKVPVRWSRRPIGVGVIEAHQSLLRGFSVREERAQQVRTDPISVSTGRLRIRKRDCLSHAGLPRSVGMPEQRSTGFNRIFDLRVSRQLIAQRCGQHESYGTKLGCVGSDDLRHG
jgi:hypothetical protein